ncbi:hypothetical protein EKI60_04345 [Candidatus Saccharibacteria bacterium]|nr:MAG: hypothetical protein EKI60_04345 [Candidatus Saccharibacteria bacterium]
MRSGLPYRARVRQQRKNNADGFTITESLIFLAVSAAILMSALSLFSGSQNKTQFSQAMDDINQRITTVINNVANGYYPRTSQVTDCNVTGDPVLPIETAGANAEEGRGTVGKCIFIGRIIQFMEKEEVFRIYNVVGARQKSTAAGPREVESLVEAKPNILSDFEQLPLKNGIAVKKLRRPATGDTGGAVAFFTSFGQYETVGSEEQLVSGSLVADFALIGVPLDPGPLSGVAASTATQLTSQRSAYDVATSPYVRNPKGGIELCFYSGTTDQHGILLIGGEGSGSSTTVTIKSGACP